jgi:hypothetical protein
MKIVMFLLCVLYLSSFYAQKTGAKKTTPQVVAGPNELDEQYKPPKNSLFDEDAEKKGDMEGYGIDFKNTIKFNPFLLGRSIFSIGYERKIFSVLTGSAYLGYNFKRDWIQALSTEFSDDNDVLFSSSKVSDVPLTSILRNGIFKSGGIYGSLGLRLYLDEDHFDGSYIELQTRFNNYKLDFSNFESYDGYLIATGSRSDVSINNSASYLVWGSQFCSTGKINTTHDFYLGIGLRTTSYNIFTYNSSSNYDIQPDYIISDKKESSNSISIIMGYAFGIGVK